MGIENSELLANPDAPDTSPSVVPPKGDYISGPTDREKFEAQQRALAEDQRNPHNEVKQQFAETRDQIDAEYATTVAAATEKRDAAHAANLKDHEELMDIVIESNDAARAEARVAGLS